MTCDLTCDLSSPAVATEPAAAEQHASSLVVGVVIAVLLALIILGDLTCYAVSNRGITHLLCSRARGTADSAKLTEEAARCGGYRWMGPDLVHTF